MLTENFLASISSIKKADTSFAKNASIFQFEFQPQTTHRHVFKKSATPRNCLAVSASHIFAAQADKSAIHVYNRERGTWEETVYLPEKVSSLTLAVQDTVLVLGTETGRIFLWETCTGRLVTTAQHHLQSVTALAVDSSSVFLLSGSADSNIHVWPLVELLSFSPAASDGVNGGDSRPPLRTVDLHRGGITALAAGHSSSASNIAVSVSRDKTAIVWNYRKGIALRTYLLPETPLALALDPVDRAFHVSYEDGSVQLIDLYGGEHASSIDMLRDESSAATPIQPPASSRWFAEGQDLGPGLSLSLNWEGTKLISAHESGKMVAWDVGRGQCRPLTFTLPGPISNVIFLRPAGLPDTQAHGFKINQIVKPKLDLGRAEDGIVPGNYTFTSQFTGRLDGAGPGSNAPLSPFEAALTHHSFPGAMLYDGIAELNTFSEQPVSQGQASDTSVDYMALDEADSGAQDGPRRLTMEEQNEELRKLIRALQRVQKATFKQVRDLMDDRKHILEIQRKCDEREIKWKQMRKEKRERETARAATKGQNGASASDLEESEEEEASEAESEKSVGMMSEVEADDGD